MPSYIGMRTLSILKNQIISSNPDHLSWHGISYIQVICRGMSYQAFTHTTNHAVTCLKFDCYPGLVAPAAPLEERMMLTIRPYNASVASCYVHQSTRGRSAEAADARRWCRWLYECECCLY